MRPLYLALSFAFVFLAMYLTLRLWPQPHFTCPHGFHARKVYLRGSLIYTCVEEDAQ